MQIKQKLKKSDHNFTLSNWNPKLGFRNHFDVEIDINLISRFMLNQFAKIGISSISGRVVFVYHPPRGDSSKGKSQPWSILLVLLPQLICWLLMVLDVIAKWLASIRPITISTDIYLSIFQSPLTICCCCCWLIASSCRVATHWPR